MGKGGVNVVARPINILSLCSGIGGLDIGVSRALESLGFSPRTVCYVEGEAFAAACLVKQMETGRLDEAPIWSDVKTFDCEPWRGKVDCVLGGFPCQPFSLAGKQLAEKDPRHLWPDVLWVLKESGATIAFFENVPGLVRKGLCDVIGDLSGAGFNAEWGCYSAAEEGFSHKRKRLFILAYADGQRESQPERLERKVGGWISDRYRKDKRRLEPWTVEPAMVRSVHGIPSRVDRIRALGNAVVPATAKTAFRELWERAAQ